MFESMFLGGGMAGIQIEKAFFSGIIATTTSGLSESIALPQPVVPENAFIYGSIYAPTSGTAGIGDIFSAKVSPDGLSIDFERYRKDGAGNSQNATNIQVVELKDSQRLYKGTATGNSAIDAISFNVPEIVNPEKCFAFIFPRANSTDGVSSARYRYEIDSLGNINVTYQSSSVVDWTVEYAVLEAS